MNVPLIAGGAAAAVGLTIGVVAERISHDNLKAEQAGVDSQRAAGREWIDNANKHFGDEITADRLHTRDLNGQIEDYKIENPKPGGVQYGREQYWREDVQLQNPDREGFWGLTAGAAGAGGGLVGGFTLGIAMEGGLATTGAKVGAGIGAALLAGGLGIAAGSIISNWTH